MAPSRPEPQIRAYRESDARPIAELFYRAVHETASSHYDEEARKAWAPAPRPAEDWHARLSAIETFVAEYARGIAGFMTLEPDGHIDFAYVRPDVAGRGIAGALYAHIEALALSPISSACIRRRAIWRCASSSGGAGR